MANGPELLFAPLGGVGEIGMNLALYGIGEGGKRTWMVVDIGVSFAGDDLPGVDLIMPDIAFLIEQRKNIAGLVLTHAHEDHFGALMDLWPRLRVPVYATPFTAALFVGRLSPAVGDVAAAARMAPAPPGPARAPDLLLDGLALLVTEGYAAGTPALRRALLAFRGQDVSAEEGLSWLWLAGLAAVAVWDDETWHILASRHVKLAREAGALSELPLAIRWRILLHTHAGELEQGAALIAEAQAVADATGSQLGPHGALGVAAGDQVEGDINPAGFRGHLLDVGVHRLLVQGIEGGDLYRPATGFDFLSDPVERLACAANQEDSCPLAGEGSRHAAPDSPAAAVNDRRLAFE